jgi:hypothetical protein
MLMAVVRIGVVRMRMLQRLVFMPVRMWLLPRPVRGVSMPVMFIVLMFVIVFQS